MTVSPVKRNRLFSPGAKGVRVYWFTGLSNESAKSNVLPCRGNILLACCWNKINLIKFAFFDFALKKQTKKKKKKKTLELKKSSS